MLQRDPASTRPRIGIDLVAVDRVARLRRENPEALATVFTDAELQYCLSREHCDDHLAARFAAKEAVLKALGVGLGARMQWSDVEVVRERTGRPTIRLHRAVADWAAGRGVSGLEVSLSHTAGFAVASVVLS